jgi:hypothetical protein
MAQHDAVIDDADGLAFLADLNDFTAAIISNNSGSSTPSVTYPYQWWADTTSGYMKQRNAANSAWITLFSIASGNLAQLGGMNMTGEINEKRSTVAATATTTQIWDAGTGNIIDATGTPTITDFPDASQAGSRRIVYFAAGTIITNNANIEVEGAANYTIVAGDRIEIEALTTSTFKAWIKKKDGTAMVASSTILRNYIQGVIFSTAGSSATFSVTAGQAADSTNAVYLNLAAISKTTSAWAVGSATGGLDQGAIANNTWYTPYIIRRPDTGVVDLIFSTNTTSPTLPANYTQYRKLDGMPLRTNGSGQWIKFLHTDNEVQWDVPVLDVNAASSTGSSTNYTLSVPVGVRVNAKIDAGVNAAGNFGIYIHCPDIASAVPDATAAPLGTVYINGSGAAYIKTEVITNTSSQISARMNNSATIRFATLGWITDRGRNA